MSERSAQPLEARLGVCSWSLRPSSAEDLATKVGACGVRAVQLALDPLRSGAPEWSIERTRLALDRAGITILSGMMAMEGEDYSTLESIALTGGVRPDAAWPANLARAGKNAEIASALGMRLVTFHAGFVPHDRSDPERARIIDRTGQIAQPFLSRGIAVALETGQESAATLIPVLQELSIAGTPVGVNFDPANMILYGTGRPLEAFAQLAPWVRQVHIKDAAPTSVPGTWGEEKPAGRGAVPWAEFFAAWRGLPSACDLVIEREGGDQRVEDVAAGAAMARRLVPGIVG